MDVVVMRERVRLEAGATPINDYPISDLYSSGHVGEGASRYAGELTLALLPEAGVLRQQMHVRSAHWNHRSTSGSVSCADVFFGLNQACKWTGPQRLLSHLTGPRNRRSRGVARSRGWAYVAFSSMLSSAGIGGPSTGA